MNWILRNLVFSSLLAIGIFSFIFFSETGSLPDYKVHWESLLVAIFLANIGGAGLYFINKQFNLSLPWNRKRGLRFIADLLTGVVLFSLLASIFYLIVIAPSIEIDTESTFWTNYWDGVVKFLILLVVLLYIYSLINFSMFSYNQYAVVQIESISHERNQLNLQFEALKTQLNPHFLFNSLNTISSLTYRDVSMAEGYIRKLAGVYQYLLSTEKQKLVQLKDELKMVESFFFMLQIKYEDCIDMNISLQDKTLLTYIPPLTIQLLVENVMKHNQICEGKRIEVNIYSDENHLIVKNNLIAKPELLRVGNDIIERPKENGSHKIGLENIRKRYAYFTSQDIVIERNDFFIVKLPILKESFEK